MELLTWLAAVVTLLCLTRAESRIKRPLLEFPEIPMEILNNRVSNVGPPLRAYTGSPQNHRLKTSSDTETKVGGPMSLKVSTFENRDHIKACNWTSPAGVVYTVDNNGVNVNGQAKDDVNGFRNETNCHLSIKAIEKSQLGVWKCSVELNEIPMTQEAFFTATTAIRVSDVRLPKHLKPEKYVVYLTPFIVENNFTIEGNVDIIINVLKEGSNITLHIKDMTIYEDTVKVTRESSGQDIQIMGFGYDEPRQFFIINLGTSLTPGDKIRVYIAYRGNLNNDLCGFYRSSYFDKITNRSEYIATTQFEATDARRALPCFDEPSLKAKFQINLGRTKDRSSISNMPIEKQGVPMKDNDEYVWDQYQESLQMSTYLLAFVVSRFTFRQGEPRPNGVQFRIWSRASAYDQTAYAARAGPRVLEFFEKYYNIPFPLPKQDMIAIPDFSAGAMENWGLITYREVALLYEKGKSSIADREYVATVVAHEVAHQWFGDLVTMEWWDDLWLNEGFASYMEYLGAAFLEPTTEILDRFPLESIHPTFMEDGLQSSHPISVPVNHPDEINEIFDQISYGKGGSIIRMMANFLGVENFNHGVTNYLKRHKYQNAKQDDLWQALTEAAHMTRSLEESLSVKEVMDTWTLQMGYPVVTVERSYNGSSEQIIFSQKRFLLIEDKTIVDNHDYRWWIPISYTKPGGNFSHTKNSIWLTPNDTRTTKTFDNVSPSDPVIVNLKQTGFYRVNYDETNWQMISQTLLMDHDSIDRINRAQILDDSFNLARAGLLDYKIALSTTEYLVREQEFIPWKAALSVFKYLELMLARTPAFGDFKKYVVTELLPVYKRVGFVKKESDTFMDISLRELIVEFMCKYGFKDCLATATSMFKEWMESQDVNGNKNIPTNLRKAIYCTAISEGGEEEWDFLWNVYLKSNNANEKSNILKALACSNEIWILQRYLDMTLDSNSGVRKQDGSGVISHVASNKIGRYITWNWIRAKWSNISSYFDTAISSTVGRMISGCARDFTTELELAELEKFYQDHLAELGTGKRETEIAIQNVKANVEWTKSYYGKISEWLEKSSKSPKKKLSNFPLKHIQTMITYS